MISSQIALSTTCKPPALAQMDCQAKLNALLAKMPPHSVAIFSSSPEYPTTPDVYHPFRQHSNLLALNGFNEPNSALVVCRLSGKRERCLIMFVQPKDRAAEVWTGIRCGVDGAKKSFLASEAFAIDQLETELPKLLAQAKTVFYRFGVNTEFDETFRKLWAPSQKTLSNPDEILSELRLIKSEPELALMQTACDISAAAHVAAMKMTRPGLYEYHLQAQIEYQFRINGNATPSYGTIVAGGNNAVVLHYVANNDELADGDLVLVDAGCEYGGYASDITRTWPVSGNFTEPQRQIYQLVLNAEKAAIKAVRPGTTLGHVNKVACDILRRGLQKLGILPKATKAPLKSKKETTNSSAPLCLDDFFMHGLSHWMGRDVHDVGRHRLETPSGRKGRHRTLEPGMAFTIEPGLYFDRDDMRIPPRYRGIGVRIEDDVVVTADGHKVLTNGVVKEIADIEATMRGQS